MSKCRSDETDRLAVMFQALSSAQRLRVFIKLMSCCPPGECSGLSPEGMRQCVGDLGKDLGLAASTVSYHLKELRQAGLMQVERRGKTVECWIDPDAVRQLAAFFVGSKGRVVCGVEVAARQDDAAARGDEMKACGDEAAVQRGGRSGIEVR